MNHEHEQDRLTEEAALWLLNLEEHPDDADLRARFEQWLNQDPQHAEAWAEASMIYDMVTLKPPAYEAHWASHAAARRDSAAEKFSAATRKIPGAAAANRTEQPRTGWRRFALGAAGLGLAASLLLFVLPGLMLQVQADFVTVTAEVQTRQLEDGSTISLAPNSAVAIDFTIDERRVRLLQGEAFFAVAPDSTRPFQVTAADVTATVLGTAFNVWLDDEATKVSIREGRVRVQADRGNNNRPARLTAGQWIRIDGNSDMQRGRIEPDDVGAWREGLIIARERPMGEVLDELRGYHRGLIVLTDATLGVQRVTGVYNVDDPVKAVQLLAKPLHAQVRQITPWLLIVSPE